MSLVYLTGQDVPLSVTVTNDTGQPANATTVIVTVTNPDASTQTPPVTNTGTGLYSAIVPPLAAAGTYLVRWSATGSGFSWVSETQFQVRPAGVEQVVDLPSVKAHLNIPLTDSSQNDELTGFILAATPIIRNIVGPILPETHTEWFDGGSPTLVLAWQPVTAILSATEYYGLAAFPLTEQPLGSQSNAFGFTVDLLTGQLTRRTFSGEAARFAQGAKNIRVTYTAARADVPYNVRLGALELIRHLWQLTQQGGRPKFGSSGAAYDGDSDRIPIGFAVPNRVTELLAPHRRPPGIA
ncbi:hypothetical protein Lfu02_17660 [Longispora fulva]|uniref:Uncharacterized protein n=1 Tax=Longispora fulva TaxID=619741 RepID=A0A8J7GJ48_9ACTN|nr:hypothetical protein [Longispora fulva]MBG6140229.1 hypothetical protein [Longispora fulva]GIG57394.1 hypothetical protein Lfu02_17660 [Longispora fulva]